MKYNLEQGKFKIEEYDKQKCFSSFLPGIAGKNGIPMWVFYVNRGQGIASFGIENKDRAIMEFKPADQSYTATTLKGFRTFIKVDGSYYEAFSPFNNNTERSMVIDKNTLSITEKNKDYNLEVTVDYFTMPNEEYTALVRRVEVKNLGDKTKEIEVIDGISELLPYGISNTLYKEMGFTARAWMEVANTDTNIPFYKVRTAVGDIEVVEEIKSSYFYIAGSNDNLLETIYDRNILFGHDTSLQLADNFKNNSLDEVLSKTQHTENILPCAFGTGKKTLEPMGTYRINSMIGFSEDGDYINKAGKSLIQDEYIDTKKKEAKDIVDTLVEGIKTKTSNEVFDSYCEQNYLDNILRGGYPLIFKNKEGRVVYHIYSRKHGDLERDYNFFSLQPNKYSQGNGNFRDVLQNRRNDIFFNPEVEDFNLKMFMNFIQVDGNNPLVIKGTTFKLAKVEDKLLDMVEGNKEDLISYLSNEEFTPGEVLSYIKERDIKLKVEENSFIEELLYNAEQFEQGEFGEGYWIDHWTYLMDLVESYEEIYPDKIQELFFLENTCKFFDSEAYIKARRDKYKIYKGKVMQIGAVEESEEKERLIKDRGHHYLVDIKGEIYKTSLISKLILLAVTKFTTLDPYGMGLEMEGNKPGWNDALNGLPGMIGSGMSESLELKRLVNFILALLDESKKDDIKVPKEFAQLLEAVELNIDNYNKDNKQFEYWDSIAKEKESYREKVFFGVEGSEKTYKIDRLAEILKKVSNKLEEGIKKAKEYGKGIYPTYFSYELVDYSTEGDTIIPKEFKLNILPYFLEGPTRAFKIIDIEERKELYKYIKESNIYDKKLMMYKTSESILDQPHDIGRLRAFTPGWLENESVFMHMEFKYLLAILKGGLSKEFFQDIKTALPPYLDYSTYGRSIIENSSFIVSSANSNKELHGQGFSARLSGSTAEFLSMWKYIFVGQKLFEVEDGELCFTFEPQIEGDFFDKDGTVAFSLFSSIPVRYINNSRVSTWDTEGVNKIEIKVEGKVEVIEGNKLKGRYAELLRDKKVEELVCYFN